MMKKRIGIILLAGAMLLLSGCTKSNIVRPGNEDIEPDFSTKEEVVYSWGQVSAELEDFYTNNEEYPGLAGYNFNTSQLEEQNLLQAEIFLEQQVDTETAARYAAEFIKNLNDILAVQDFGLEKSSPDTYGGFFTKHDFQVKALRDEGEGKDGELVVDMQVKAGTNTQIVPLEGK